MKISNLQNSLDNKKVEVEAIKMERDELIRNLKTVKESLKDSTDKLSAFDFITAENETLKTAVKELEDTNAFYKDDVASKLTQIDEQMEDFTNRDK